MQDDAGYLGPVRTVPLGVEQAQIGHEMRLVINGDVGTIGRLVIDIGIKFGPHPHIGRPPFHLDFWTPARTGSADRTGWAASQSGPLEGLAKHSFWPSPTSTIHRLRLCPQHYSKRPEHHPSPYPEYHGSIRIGTIVPRTIIP